LVYDINSARPARESDAVAPVRDYPASKVAAEGDLHESGLNWSILRFGFVYGENDGHLQSIPRLAGMFKWHPANRLSMIHHRDIAVCVRLGLTGVFDGRVVNVADEAPISIWEISELVGAPVEPSAMPLENPWWGQMDGSLARSLGFRPTVATTWQAAREGAL
jgi:UDP-glucose 4-epimerase